MGADMLKFSRTYNSTDPGCPTKISGGYIVTYAGENACDTQPLILIGMISDCKVVPPFAEIKNVVLYYPRRGLAVYTFTFLQSCEFSGVGQRG